MNVLIFTKSTNVVGGVEKVVDIHCEWLRKLDIKVNIVSLKKTSYEIFKKINYENISKNKIYYCDSIFSKNLGFSLINELLNQFKFVSKVIVHQPFLNGLLGIIISTLINKLRKKRIPELFFYHHAIPSKNILAKIVYIFLSKILFKINKKTILIASSNSIENINFSKIINTNLKIIPIPIPKLNNVLLRSNKFNETGIKYIPKKSKDIFDFVYIGRIAKYKGLINLVKSVPFLKGNIRLIIAGAGPMSKKINSIINKYPTETREKVIFINKYLEENEKYEILKFSDAFVFPSITKSEAYGIMQLEALFMGLPIINTFLGTGVNIVAKESDYVITFKEINSYKALARSINEMECRLSSNKFNLNPKYIRDETIKYFSEEIIRNQFLDILGLDSCYKK